MSDSKPTTVHLVPVEGRSVRDPFSGQIVPKEGVTVEPNRYWIRRLRDGDVEKAGAAKPAAKKSKPTQSKASD